jgi:hypothetical protein
MRRLGAEDRPDEGDQLVRVFDDEIGLRVW